MSDSSRAVKPKYIYLPVNVITILIEHIKICYRKVYNEETKVVARRLSLVLCDHYGQTTLGLIRTHMGYRLRKQIFSDRHVRIVSKCLKNNSNVSTIFSCSQSFLMQFLLYIFEKTNTARRNSFNIKNIVLKMFFSWFFRIIFFRQYIRVKSLKIRRILLTMRLYFL